MIGKTISHYKVLEKLGGGGMGVVYKATDTKLDRYVALKFLPPSFSLDDEAKQRFIHEAKAASALEHSNIFNIHEIDETDDGQLFIVMAYYDGETLKKKIGKGPLKIDEAIDITLQIAEGLSKAHEKNIIHRDIKPANIFITDDGVVKILDFGLAKVTGHSQITKTSSTSGTVAYMSPEQSRGETVDHRTDIWSLGVVLYEMLTSQLPFKGDYEQAIIYSILNEEPALLNSLPAELEKILSKSLQKNPDERYHHVDEMSVDLIALKKEPLHPGRKKFSKPLSKQMMAILAFIVLVALTIVVYLLIQTEEYKGFQIKHTSPLTTVPGLEQDPTWSPEGTRIAYASSESGNIDIWVKQIAAGQKINLTKDHLGYDGNPAWSPDGEWIAFVSDRDGGGIFVIPALGGIPKQVIPLDFGKSFSRIGPLPNISWSPDGSDLAYAVAGNLFTISSAGGTASTVPLPPTGLIVGYSEPAWSPDGKRIACTGFVAEGVSTGQIWSLPHRENDPLPVTDGKHMDHSPVWASDGKHIFFISDRGGSSDVWCLPVDNRGSPTGQASPLTSGAGVGDIALSKDGTKLVYTKVVDRSNIWSIPILTNRILTLADALPITSENHYIENLDVSPNGQWIAFDSNRRGNMDIWIMRKDGSELRQLTTNQAHDWYPKWSPDGKKILFHSMRNGNRDLFIIPVRGGIITQLTDHPAEDLAGIWSPNEERIAFSSNRSGNMDAWVMPSGGGDPKQLTFETAPDLALLWSPDGQQIVFSTNRTGYYELFFIPEELFLKSDVIGNPTRLTRGEWVYISAQYWIKDEQMIYAYGVGGQFNQGTNLWAISVADGSARPILDLRSCLMEPSHSLSSDGDRIYFPLWERVSDLWVVELSSND